MMSKRMGVEGRNALKGKIEEFESPVPCRGAGDFFISGI
jgi:hypothetical protein